MQKNAVDFHVEHEHRETEVLLCVNCDSEAGYAAGMMNCHFFHAPINRVATVRFLRACNFFSLGRNSTLGGDLD